MERPYTSTMQATRRGARPCAPTEHPNRSPLPEHLLVRHLIKSHDQGPALPYRGGAEVAAGPEDEGEEVGLRGLLLLEVEADGLLALGGVERVHPIEEGEGVLPAEPLLPGVRPLGGLDALLRKEPLRLGAGGSARAVVVPVGLGGHGGSPNFLP